jgi:dipeptidase E
MTRPNLLLLSSSKFRDTGYLSHAIPVLKEFLGADLKQILFIPYANAAKQYDLYEANVAEALEALGVTVQSIHHASEPVAAIHSATVVAIGGGNTFALLSRLKETGLIDPIRQIVGNGTAYIGWSAGANVACPTISTTNDMPICQPSGLDALGLIPFQLNAHFIEGQIDGHNGESREQRLAEYLAIYPEERVVALPEGTAIFQKGAQTVLRGEADGILFTSQGRQIIKRDEDLSWILTNK